MIDYTLIVLKKFDSKILNINYRRTWMISRRAVEVNASTL